MDNSSIDKIRKRRFSTWCFSFGLPLVLIFCVIDFIEHDIDEMIVDIIIGIVIGGGFFSILRFNADQIVYRVCLYLLCFLYVYAVATASGMGTALYWLFMLPPLLFFFLGKKEGLTGSLVLLGLVSILLLAPFLLGSHDYGRPESIRFIVAFSFVIVVAYGLEASRHRFSQLLEKEQQLLRDEKKQLQAAMDEIKTLSGLLPVCAHCKKVRDDKGYWKQIEEYIQDHTDASFSHSICPICIKKHYADLDIEISK